MWVPSKTGSQQPKNGRKWIGELLRNGLMKIRLFVLWKGLSGHIELFPP